MRWYEQLPAPRRLERLGHLMGLSVSLQPREKVRWRNEILPALIEIDDGGLMVIESLDSEGKALYWLNDSGDVQREAELVELLLKGQGSIVLLGRRSAGRMRVSTTSYSPTASTGSGNIFAGPNGKSADLAGLDHQQRTGTRRYSVFDAGL